MNLLKVLAEVRSGPARPKWVADSDKLPTLHLRKQGDKGVSAGNRQVCKSNIGKRDFQTKETDNRAETGCTNRSINAGY